MAVATTLVSMTHTLRGLGELLAYLPYELGFVPTDSLVAVGLSQGSVDVVARLDLVPRGGYLTAIDRTAVAFIRAGVHDVICCVVLDGVTTVSGAQVLLNRARSRFGLRGIDVRHLLVMTDKLWWAHRCDCRSCPTRPTHVPRPEQVAAVFSSVLEGVAPVSSREALAAGLRGLRGDLAAQVAAEFVKRTVLSTEALAAALWEILQGATPVEGTPAELLAAVSVSLVDPIVRDDIFGWVTPGLPQPPGCNGSAEPTALQRAWALRQTRAASGAAPAASAAASRARMTQWLRCLPDPLRPPVLTFIAGSAWSCGAGALAAVAVEQVLAIDPEYRLAQLLAHVLAAGVRPGNRPEPIGMPVTHH